MSLERRLDRLAEAFGRSARGGDAQAVADALRAVGADVLDPQNNVVVLRVHEDDTAAHLQAWNSALTKLEGTGTSDGVVVVFLDTFAPRAEAAP